MIGLKPFELMFIVFQDSAGGLKELMFVKTIMFAVLYYDYICFLRAVRPSNIF